MDGRESVIGKWIDRKVIESKMYVGAGCPIYVWMRRRRGFVECIKQHNN